MKRVHHERHRVIEPTTRTSGNLLTAHSSSRPPPPFLTICPIFCAVSLHFRYSGVIPLNMKSIQATDVGAALILNV